MMQLCFNKLGWNRELLCWVRKMVFFFLSNFPTFSKCVLKIKIQRRIFMKTYLHEIVNIFNYILS